VPHHAPSRQPQGRADTWDIASHRLALARTRILCKNHKILQALDELEESGKLYGGHLRRGDLSDEDLTELRARNTRSIQALASASAPVIRRRLRTSTL
jgi:hypothetical protein